MIRFIRELLKPALKCERVGHKRNVRPYRGYERTSSTYAIADRVSGNIYYCSRCDLVHDRSVNNRSGIQGLTMPSSDHQILREKGFLET